MEDESHIDKDLSIAIRVLEKTVTANTNYIVYLLTIEIHSQIPEVYLAERNRTEIESAALKRVIGYLRNLTD